MIKFFLAFLLVASPLASEGFKYELSICAIFQDDAPYLKEWIDYHRSVGVEHFWLYNNNSTDNYLEVLQPYVEQNIVDLFDWPSEEKGIMYFCYVVQSGAYDHAVELSKGVTKWLAAIDTDEFIVPVSDNDIVHVLEKEFSTASGVCVNWQFYGTSHVKKCQSIIKELLYKMRTDHLWNHTCKSIVKPEDVLYCASPHWFEYNEGCFDIDCGGDYPNNGMSKKVHIDKLRINHYWTRDEYYFNNFKIPRRLKWGANLKELLQIADQMNQEYDDCMLSLTKGKL